MTVGAKKLVADSAVAIAETMDMQEYRVERRTPSPHGPTVVVTFKRQGGNPFAPEEIEELYTGPYVPTLGQSFFLVSTILTPYDLDRFRDFVKAAREAMPEHT